KRHRAAQGARAGVRDPARRPRPQPPRRQPRRHGPAPPAGLERLRLLMAVFTEVSESEAGALLRALKLGELRALRGIQGGIENTNYFVTAEQDGHTHEYVLTLFERLGFEQLPFYLHLMKHLAQRGIPVPDPAGNASGDILHT